MEQEQKRLDAEMEREQRKMEMEQKKIDAEMEREQKKIDADKEIQLAKIQSEAQQHPNDNHGNHSRGNGAKVPRLPTFQDGKDSLDAYLERFERFATNHKWPKETWASSLSALITGKALEVYSRLSAEEAENFDILKKALLARYDLNAEGFRRKLRDSGADEMESPAQFITRLESYLNKWIDLTGVNRSFEGVCQLVLMEQFIATCSTDLATFLKERTCKTLEKLGDFANKYLEAHSKQMKDVSRP